ncbi:MULTISPECIES: type VII secretion protein EssC [unclassified Granulicatella]|uniref:type VII secretion protein EssC n=1 Tax=unclassified Granulicatella TaxID=2630493 RepID=UPI001073B0FE|nr:MULTISPECIES: type VII secretion protein EssC [unclassified Granulicatella]MBF0780478.1 type VII secretion protein EssC [Granulicatella sp. 19428wC4_WM01]TFU95377.1 type VII secretion protein EssC [Granulicatella sp. WM01]
MAIYLIHNNETYPLYSHTIYTLGKEKTADIILPIDERTLQVEEDSVIFENKHYGIGRYDIILSNEVSVCLLVLKAAQHFLISDNTLYLSSDDTAHIKVIDSLIESVFVFKDDDVLFTSTTHYFLNGKKKSGTLTIQDNDVIVFAEGIVLSIQNKVMSVSTLFEIETTLVPSILPKEDDRGKEFHRSPRIILRAPEGKVTIASAPTHDELNKQSLLKLLLTPVAMMAFTGASYFFFRSGPMIIMMMGMSLITIGTSIHSYLSDKKTHAAKQVQKQKDYLNYLDNKYTELAAYKQEQEHSLEYHYPSMIDILGMAQKVDRRLYEKTPHHFDFLTYRLGLGEVSASFQIDYTDSELTEYHQEVKQKVQELLSYYRMIDNVPITNVVNRPIGYIGNRKLVVEQVQQLMIQIAAFHSYHDVQFMPIFREEELGIWQWSRWLPHTKIKAFNSRGFIYNQRTRDQLLTSLYQIIKERKLNSEQDKNNEKKYAPSYILFITDLSLLLDHNIIEYINEDLTHLGIYYVFVEEVIESLPEHVQTVVDYRGDKKAKLILQEGVYLNQPFIPLPAISKYEKELFARHMAGITHVQTLRNAIPESITFLEMYGVERVDELHLLKRWSENETYQTMAVPLGVRGRDDILYLNLHEKAHGPHGLIAGTTGSGKSELVQSYILSLAVNYHPYEVAFLLIDYKGGGMANLFADLPHVVGTITNLDGNQAHRALVSIQAELKKRQRIFLENDVNHINQYMKLFKEGKVSEPLPHLLIISDEFAELKTNQPEFMDELVSTARIGRSLGVKLILATQKPSGVVNDQIWSNSKFKIALKVQDVADSREVIKTPDAAEITQTGRAYLQVGNNEIYELFQSAWSGADYNPDGKHHNQKNIIIYEITDNGQYAPINRDLSGLDKQKDVKSVPTELDAIVENAHDVFKQLNIPKVASPWLPPLKDKVYAKDLQSVSFKEYWNTTNDLTILVGYQDIPEKQEQSPLYFNMEQTGHILLVSSPGFGKSTFIQTLAVDVMRKQTPEQSHFYLYDFGASGLISLTEFPHVADYFTMDESEKIMKSLRRLSQMVKDRKQALAKLKTTNLKQYNQLSSESFPTVFIAIDGFDSVPDMPFADSFYDVLNVIARDGASLGIYLMVTLSRLNAMRLQLQSNFKTKISLFLFDNSDLSGIVGRSNIALDEIKGRAITKLEGSIIQFQIALAYNSDNYSEYIEAVKREAQVMTQAYQGKLPENIPMLPEKVTLDVLEPEFSTSNFVFGLDREKVEPALFTLNKAFLMAAENPGFITHYYRLLAYHVDRLHHYYNAVILDSNQRLSNQLFEGVQKFTASLDIENVVKTIVEDLKKRLAHPHETYAKWLIVIPDIAHVARIAELSEEDFKLLVVEGPKYGVTPVFVGSYQDLVNNTYDTYVKLSLQLVEQVFLGVRISDQNHTRYPYMTNEPTLKQNQGYILKPEYYEFVQLLEL